MLLYRNSSLISFDGFLESFIEGSNKSLKLKNMQGILKVLVMVAIISTIIILLATLFPFIGHVLGEPSNVGSEQSWETYHKEIAMTKIPAMIFLCMLGVTIITFLMSSLERISVAFPVVAVFFQIAAVAYATTILIKEWFG